LELRRDDRLLLLLLQEELLGEPAFAAPAATL
jgi:hypothetical protein